MTILLAILLFIIPVFHVNAEQRHTLSGTVRDARTGESLPGVNVFIPRIQAGTVTDLKGEYSLRLREDEYVIVFSFIGYSDAELKITLTEDTQLNVSLDNGGIRLSEVVVSAERSRRNVEKTDMGTVSLSIESIRNIPAFLGETDVLRSIQLLPGVQSAGDGNTGFFVRGGNADHNLVLLDEAVVYNASHLFNFFSVFNPDAVKDISLYKGGISPEYGGRLASVLDVSMKEGDLYQYKTNGGIGLISSRLTLEGPIQYGRSSFLVSGRRTYADLFLKLSSDPTQRESQLYFYDLNAKTNYVINPRNRISFTGYYGKDITIFSDLFSFDWGNTTASLNWNRTISPRLSSDVSLLYSNYQFNIAGDIGPSSFRWNSTIDNLSLKAGANYLFADNNSINMGVQSTLHNLNPGTIRAEIENAAAATFELTKSNALEHGLYFEQEVSLFNQQLAINYGVRSSFFQIIGPGTQYTYDKTDPLRWTAKDTLNLERGNIYDSYHHWEPRLSLRFTLTENSSVKASYNRMVQYIQQSQSAQSVAPYDVWYPVSNNIPPQLAEQVSVGFFRNFSNDLIETSVELYYKDMKNVTDVIDNGDILGNEFLEAELRTGKGWAYGAEFLVQKESGKLSGFVGYTWALSKRKIEDINEGRAYFAPNDRRHDLSLSGSYQWSSRWSMGMSFIYATGTAATLPVGKLFYQNAFAPIYSDRNSGRLPDYHRLDLSVTYTPRSRQAENRRFKSSWNFSVFNVYGRVNPISVSYAEKAEKPGIPNSSFFYIPGPIPAITWNFSF